MAPPETGYCSTVQAVYSLRHCIMYFAYYILDPLHCNISCTCSILTWNMGKQQVGC
jgi:hypothetical protein